MLNKTMQTINTTFPRIMFTTKPTDKNNYKQSKLYNLNSSEHTYFESDEYLPPETLVLVEFLDDYSHNKGDGTNNRYLPAKVDWCFNNGDSYETAILFINNQCDQCYQELAFEKICRTENENILCDECYYRLESLSNSMLKNCIENRLLGNVL